MQKLNCKMGDLAIVVSAELLQNIGQIVEVLGLQNKEPFELSGRGHAWKVRTVSGRATLHYRFNSEGGRFAQYAEGPVPDRCLRPVSGLEGSGATEAWTSNGQRPSLVKIIAVMKASEMTAWENAALAGCVPIPSLKAFNRVG